LLKETRNSDDGKVFHYPVTVPYVDGESNVVEFFNPSGHREALPSFGRLIERNPEPETELIPVGR